MQQRSKLAALSVAGALTLAACGGAATSATTTTEPSTTTTTTLAPTTTEAAPATQRFLIEIANVSDGFLARTAATFAVPIGATDPGPALPGDAYEWVFEAAPGERLSFATMFVQSNDWFFAPGTDGIALFDDAGNPVTGDVTDQILVWDSGTEVDQEPGVGADQAPRQAGPDTGDADPDNTVRQVEDRDASAYVTVSLAHEDGVFTLTIDNTSADADVPTPLAPGTAVLHSGASPLFVEGQPDAGYGLEGLAEDGAAMPLTEWVLSESGVTTPLAPGVAIALVDGATLFVSGSPDTGEGLEGLAEDGDAGPLAESTGATVFAVPEGATDPGPLFPGSSYTVEIEAPVGAHLSLATMLVQSNDWFFSLGGAGVPLFAADGSPISGDITDQVALYDSGTEIDQTPGVGADQAPRQAGPDTGADDPDTSIRTVDLGSIADYVQVTITPQG